MDDINSKRTNFKVEIRRKRINDKIGIMRANLYEKNMMSTSEEQFSDQKISALVKQTLSSKEKLIQNITAIMYASYNANPQNVHMFFPLIQDFCYILDNLECTFVTIKRNEVNIKTKRQANSFQRNHNNLNQHKQFLSLRMAKGRISFYHQTPSQKITLSQCNVASGQYFMYIQINSDQRIVPQTQKYLTAELIKYKAIEFCEMRLDRKFQNQNDIYIFANFVCVFLSNSQYLSFDEFKRVLKILESLCGLNNESIDLYILNSMIDHAQHLAQKNYEILYTKLMTEFRERYVKKKKSSIILKLLQFFKTYVGRQLQQTFDVTGESFKDEKLAKKNYERICQTILPNMEFLIENRSPQVNSMMMQICCMLVEFYFPFIDLGHQDIFVTLAKRLNKSVIATLSKYSDKAIYWQIRLVRTLLVKLQQHKIQTDIIVGFIEQNESLEAFGNLLKDKKQAKYIVEETIELLVLILESISKETLLKHEKNELYLSIIVQQLENILDAHLIEDQRVYNKIEKLIVVCHQKLGLEINMN